MTARDRIRLEELLAEQATQGLDGVSAAELRDLLARVPHGDDDGFELAAAAIELAMLGELDEMPAGVRDGLRVRGREWSRSIPDREA